MAISVVEQPPLSCGSIYCEVKGTNYGHLYFVCDRDKVIYQYPQFLRSHYSRALKKLGYSFNPKT